MILILIYNSIIKIDNKESITKEHMFEVNMAKVISIFNQKGGVGKTTSVINLAAGLGRLKQKVLIIDMDPQGNATSGIGLNKEQDKIIYDLLINEDLDVIKPTESKNVDIIPSNQELSGIDLELANTEWHYRLRDQVNKIKDDYDYILIDSPPSLSVLSIMTLIASDSIIIPVQTEYYALEGVSQLIESIDFIKENFNPDLKILGVLLTMYDGRNKLSKQVVEEVRGFFKDLVFNTTIPRNVRLAESPGYGMDIFKYDRISAGAFSYKKFAREVLKK